MSASESEVARLAESLLLAVAKFRDDDGKMTSLRLGYGRAYQLAREIMGLPEQPAPGRTMPSTGNADVDAILSLNND